MDLEQRVKMLEYEVKVLKNEIQMMLLDIQEQILVHYYPALRIDDSTPAAGTIQSLESIRGRRAELGGLSASAETKQAPREELPAGASVSPGTEERAGKEPVLKLSGWVSSSVKRIGGQRTGKLIETCVDQGWIARDSMKVLLRLASLGSDGNVPEVVAVNEILGTLLELSQTLGRGSDVEEALTIIEEANLG